MPELPEVETVMRGLSRHMVGRSIARAELRRTDLRRPVSPDLAQRVTGLEVLGFRRRGKYLLMRLSGGTSLLVHLGMSGRMVSRESDHAPATHEHLRFWMDDGRVIGFVDPRRFGVLDLVATDTEDSHLLLRALGPEPLEAAFTGAVLRARMAGRRASLKVTLLDQHVVAGLGNIYVSEALFRARLNPMREAGSLDRREALVLVRAIRQTLRDAIAAGGSSLRDYAQPDGQLGYFQHRWKVYGREGQPCDRCPRLRSGRRAEGACRLIEHAVQGGRSTYWCARTQM